VRNSLRNCFRTDCSNNLIPVYKEPKKYKLATQFELFFLVTLWRKRHQTKIELKNHEKKIVSRREVAAGVLRRDCWDCWKAKLSGNNYLNYYEDEDRRDTNFGSRSRRFCLACLRTLSHLLRDHASQYGLTICRCYTGSVRFRLWVRTINSPTKITIQLRKELLITCSILYITIQSIPRGNLIPRGDDNNVMSVLWVPVWVRISSSFLN